MSCTIWKKTFQHKKNRQLSSSRKPITPLLVSTVVRANFLAALYISPVQIFWQLSFSKNQGQGQVFRNSPGLQSDKKKFFFCQMNVPPVHTHLHHSRLSCRKHARFPNLALRGGMNLSLSLLSNLRKRIIEKRHKKMMETLEQKRGSQYGSVHKPLTLKGNLSTYWDIIQSSCSGYLLGSGVLWTEPKREVESANASPFIGGRNK